MNDPQPPRLLDSTLSLIESAFFIALTSGAICLLGVIAVRRFS